MKFAIYGDSYADGYCFQEHQDYNEHTWATHLARKLGATTIDYHASAGSPFYWTYKKIQETARHYDRIIVAVTEPMRFPVSVEKMFITGINSLGGLKNIQTRRHLQGWFMSSDLNYLNDVQEMFLRDLEHTYPNAILVPCFPSSFTRLRQRHSLYGTFSLWTVNTTAKDLVGGSKEGWIAEERVGYNQILCHLPWEWHPYIAELLYCIIVNKQRPVFNPSKWAKLGSVEQYYNIRR